MFDAGAYAAFQDAVRAALSARGEKFELHEEWARVGDWELPLLPLAQACAAVDRARWSELIRAELDRRAAEEKLGR